MTKQSADQTPEQNARAQFKQNVYTSLMVQEHGPEEGFRQWLRTQHINPLLGLAMPWDNPSFGKKVSEENLRSWVGLHILMNPTIEADRINRIVVEIAQTYDAIPVVHGIITEAYWEQFRKEFIAERAPLVVQHLYENAEMALVNDKMQRQGACVRNIMNANGEVGHQLLEIATGTVYQKDNKEVMSLYEDWLTLHTDWLVKKASFESSPEIENVNECALG
jgi:hypothetical protein